MNTFQQCAKCGFQNKDPADHCVSCGAGLAALCPQCHTPVRSSQNYCGNCRRLLRTTPDGSSRIQTPQHLIERVRGWQDGERKIVTVLFADIASSTALVDDRDAEDARRILKPTVDAMSDIVHHYEGISREQGDGIMASFGAPLALEDHAVRACYAALDMQEASLVRAAEVRREFECFSKSDRINTGPVVVTVRHGKISSTCASTAPTHIANRMEALAPGNPADTRHAGPWAKGFVRVKASDRCRSEALPPGREPTN